MTAAVGTGAAWIVKPGPDYDRGMLMMTLVLAVFLAPAAFLVRLWWKDRLSVGVEITMGVLVAAFAVGIAWSDMIWQTTADRTWSSFGVYSPVGGADRVSWWAPPEHDLGMFLLSSSAAPGSFSHQAHATIDAGWERRTAWVLVWVILGLTLWGLKHRKVRVVPLLAYIALVGFFLWAIGRGPVVHVEATLGDDDESLLLMQSIGWNDMSRQGLLPLEVWQAAADRWGQERENAQPPLDHAQSLSLMTPPDPRPLRWELTLPRSARGTEHGRFLLLLTEVQGWYLYGLALAQHLRARGTPEAAAVTWETFGSLSGLPQEVVQQLARSQ